MSAEKKENLTHQLIPGKLGNLDSNLWSSKHCLKIHLMTGLEYISVIDDH